MFITHPPEAHARRTGAQMIAESLHQTVAGHMTITRCFHTPNQRIHALQGLVSTHNERNEW